MTGAIAGTPSATTGKVVYTITARNLRGQERVKIAFAVSGDWQITHPKEWSVEMWQTWFKDELKLAEDHRIHLLKLDCAQLILLQSQEAVASKCPGVAGIIAGLDRQERGGSAAQVRCPSTASSCSATNWRQGRR